jgi:hypothetical protein
LGGIGDKETSDSGGVPTAPGTALGRHSIVMLDGEKRKGDDHKQIVPF